MASSVNFATQQYYGFNPRTIPKCQLWLDASDPDTITTVATKVTQWNDKSGNGYNVTPIGTYSNATVSSNFQNNLNALNFTGSNVYRSPNGSGTYPTDVFLVLYLKSGATRADIISVTRPDSTIDFIGLTTGAYSLNYGYNQASPIGSRSYDTGYAETPSNWVVINWTIANNNMYIRRNGAVIGSNLGYTWSTPANAAYSIGLRVAPSALGAGVPDVAFEAYLGEVVAYDAALDSSQRQQMEGYLARKWGLLGSLAATHPYKSVPLMMRNFQPPDVDGLTLWLDAMDTLTLSLTGTTVTQWRDKSRLASNTTSRTGTPVLTSNAINGRDAIDFDSATYFIGSASNTGTTLSAFGVGTMDGSNSIGALNDYVRMLSFSTPGVPDYSGTANAIPILRFSANLSLEAYRQGDKSSVAVTLATPFVAGSVFDGTNHTMTVNGTVGTPVGSTGSFGYTLYGIGRDPAVIDDRVWNGYIGEILAYNAGLSAVQRRQVEGYLAAKWGLGASLATTHPFYLLRALPSTPLFIPNATSTCTLWLDAADSSTLTLSGSSVTSWSDKSGNGNTATGSGSPGYSATALNSRPGITFNGSTQYFSLGNVLNLGTAPLHAFVVSQYNNTADAALLGKSLAGSASPRYSLLRNAGSMMPLLQTAAGGNGSGFADTSTAVRQLCMTWDRTTLQLFENGTSRFSVGFSDAGNYTSTYTFLIGAYQSATGGVPPTAGFYLNGTISEIVMYQGTLNNDQRQRVEGYLAWKWGIQANLPDAHSYKKFRP